MKRSRSANALYQTAQQCVNRHDYEQAVSLIEAIPEGDCTEEMLELLMKARSRQSRVEELMQKIDELNSRTSWDRELVLSLHELLQLKPGLDHYRELFKQLSQEFAEFDDLPLDFPHWESPGENSSRSVIDMLGLPPLILIVSLATSILFGGFMIWVYQTLADDRIPIRVYLKDKEAFVIFDNNPHKRVSGGRIIRLSEGVHRYEVYNDAGRLSGPHRFQVDPDGDEYLIVHASSSVTP